MKMDYRLIKRIRWGLLLLLAVIPCLFLPDIFSNIKIEALLRNNNLYSLVGFTYAEDKTVRCFKENPDDSEGIGYVFLPSYADMDEIEVDILAGRVEFVKGGRNISVETGAKKICSFITGEVYEMVFYNTKEEIIGSNKVIFLKSGNLPTLYVATESGNMEKLDADKTYKERGRMELFDENGTLLLADELRSISGRGNHTFSFDKKSYQIKLKSSRDVLGMGTADTWILLCNVFDTAYIRNMLTYEMALQAGMQGSPDSRYIDLYFNGSYAGMYQLSEKVEIGPNRLDITDLEARNIALNGDKLEYVDRYISGDGNRRGVRLRNNPEDITGGYLIERDFGDKFDEVISGFVTESGEAYALKSPAHASEEEIAYISGLMQELEDALIAEDGYHPKTRKHYTDYIDLESWADKYLVEEISRNNGGGGTSSYFYKQPDYISTKIFGGPVWDYDKGFGRLDKVNANTRDLALLTLYNGYTSWFYYIYQKEEFVDMVKKQYKNKFSDYLGEMADKKVDEYISLIEKSAVLDQARWKHVYRTFGRELPDYKKEAEYVRHFIRERKEFMDEIWLEDAQTCFVRFKDRDGGGNRCLVVKAGECIRNYPMEASGFRIEDTGELFDEQTPVTRDITLVGIWDEK